MENDSFWKNTHFPKAKFVGNWPLNQVNVVLKPQKHLEEVTGWDNKRSSINRRMVVYQLKACLYLTVMRYELVDLQFLPTTDYKSETSADDYKKYP